MRKKLIKLGNTKPELRPHLRRIIEAFRDDEEGDAEWKDTFLLGVNKKVVDDLIDYYAKTGTIQGYRNLDNRARQGFWNVFGHMLNPDRVGGEVSVYRWFADDPVEFSIMVSFDIDPRWLVKEGKKEFSSYQHKDRVKIDWRSVEKSIAKVLSKISKPRDWYWEGELYPPMGEDKLAKTLKLDVTIVQAGLGLAAESHVDEVVASQGDLWVASNMFYHPESDRITHA